MLVYYRMDSVRDEARCTYQHVFIHITTQHLNWKLVNSIIIKGTFYN